MDRTGHPSLNQPTCCHARKQSKDLLTVIYPHLHGIVFEKLGSPPAHRPSDQSKNKQLKQAASGRRRKNESIRHPFSQITPPTFVKLKGQSIESSSFIIKRSCAVKKSVIYIDFTTY